MTDWNKSPHLLIVVWTYLVHFSSKKEKTHWNDTDLSSQDWQVHIEIIQIEIIDIHIEIIKNMETDSFIWALRTFISRRGNIRTIQCDNESHCVGAERAS